MPFIRRFPWFVSLVGKQNTRKRPLRLRNQRLNDEPTPTKTAIAPLFYIGDLSQSGISLGLACVYTSWVFGCVFSGRWR